MTDFIIFSEEFPLIDWSGITEDHSIMVGIDGEEAEAVKLLALLGGFNPYQKAQDDTLSSFDLGQLNSLYPNATPGFELVCPYAGKKYEKILGNDGGEPLLDLWVEWDTSIVGLEIEGIFDNTFDNTFN